jgi:hypothetical protein
MGVQHNFLTAQEGRVGSVSQHLKIHMPNGS